MILYGSDIVLAVEVKTIKQKGHSWMTGLNVVQENMNSCGLCEKMHSFVARVQRKSRGIWLFY